MLFPSTIFLFVFGPIAIVGYWLIGNPRWKRVWLTAASYLFYGYWDWRFCCLLVVSTVVDYFTGLNIASEENPSKRRWWLIVSLVANLGLLGFFKYYMLVSASINHVAGWFGSQGVLPGWEIILPIGISFFTFQSMSYTIDIYRRKVQPTRDFMAFAAFVSLFPQLIAGPIVRYKEIAETLKNIPRYLGIENLNIGLFLFSCGLVKKVLIADRIAFFTDPMFENYMNLAPGQAWIAIVGFSLQLYFDFSGYSLMALGLGHLLGFKFPQNFNSPYKAVSITDFWRRWHMTLSRWLRDYLYIPLGGRDNRKVALAVTMLLGGLWHGAGWTFVIWGAYHAILLEAHHYLKGVGWIPRNRIWARFGTFFAVTIGWVFFKPTTFEASWTLLKKMFDVTHLFTKFEVAPVLLLLLAFGIGWSMLAPNAVEYIRERKGNPHILWLLVLGILTGVCILYVSEPSPFLYFQF